MVKLVYIEDKRRPERNQEYKLIIKRLGLEGVIEYCDSIEVDVVSEIIADGVICHSGMSGYNIINHFAKKNKWPFLSYSGSVDSAPYLSENEFTKGHFSVDSDYFEQALPEFVEYCQSLQRSGKND